MPIEETVLPVEVDEGKTPVVAEWEGCFTDKEVQTVISDAIMQPRILYINSYSTGEHQLFNSGREHIKGGWVYVPTGGPDGGGYVKSTASVGGQYSMVKIFGDISGGNLTLGVPENLVTKGSIQTRMNLFGITPIVPWTIQTFGWRIGEFGSLIKQVSIQLMPDLTIRAVTFDGFGNPVVVGDPSIISVPGIGWFSIETQAEISRFGNDASGYVNSQMYLDGGSPEGIKMIRAKGVKTRSSTSTDCINCYLWGTAARDDEDGIADVGFADVIICGGYGLVRRFIGDTYVGPMFAVANGDVVESSIISDGRRVFDNGVVHDVVGTQQVHGVSDRAANLIEAANISRIGESLGKFVDPPADPVFIIGSISIFTGIWLEGPFTPPPFAPIRNTFNDEQKDLYRLETSRGTVASVEGIAPFFLSGFAYQPCRVSGPGAIQFNNVGTHSPGVTRNNTIRFIYKLSGGDIADGALAYSSSAAPWLGFVQYTKDPYSFLNSDPLDQAWNKTKLDSLQAGVRGDFVLLDETNPDPEDRWIQFDIGQFGVEYAYHKQAINVVEASFNQPIAKLVVSYDDLIARASVRDVSVAWNSTIVSRVIDWGDGSPTEDIEESTPIEAGNGEWHSLTHDYTADGTYTITLTITDNLGNIKTYSEQIIVTNRIPIANFDFEVTDQTVDFTDQSTDVLGSIASRLWNFGDGNTSTATNPSHTYAAPGTYHVTLTVTDNRGATDSVETDINLAAPPPTDCSMSEFVGNLAFVQGDDFDGGNPPLPAYLDTSVFDQYYWFASIFREAYDNAYANSQSHYALDNTVLFNGHKTWKQIWGTGKRGAGWNSVPTNDGSPTETYYSNSPHNGPLALWHRMILRGDAGINTDGTVAAGDAFEGLELLTFSPLDGEVGIFVRAGRIYLDISSREATAGANITVSHDLGPESLLFDGTSFKEFIAHVSSDPTAKTITVGVWICDACNAAGVAPLIITTKPNHRFDGTTPRVGISDVSHFNYVFTPSGADKFIWVAGWSMIPDTVNANPYGVSLVFSGGNPVTVLPGRGQLTLTGFEPTVTGGGFAPQTVLPGRGQLTLDGFIPTISVTSGGTPGSGDIVVSPLKGDLILTGFRPNIIITAPSGPKIVQPGAGTLLLNSFAPFVAVTGGGAGPQPGPNEPAGMTKWRTHDCTTLTPPGWGLIFGDVSIVTDPIKGQVLQLSMIGNTTPGSGTGRIDTTPETDVFAGTKIYVRFFFKISPGYKGNNGSGGQKNSIIHTHATYFGLPNEADHMPGLINDASNPSSRERLTAALVNAVDHDGIHLSSPNDVSYYVPGPGEPGDPGDLLPRDTWVDIEVVRTANSRGVANGEMKIWINNILVAPGSFNALFVDGMIGTNIKLQYDGTLRFTGIEFTNVWGGGGTVISGVDNYYRYKNIYVSQGPARANEMPTHWNITAVGGVTTIPRGGSVDVTAQLLDGNNNSVDVFNPNPTSVSLGGFGTWALRPGTPPDYVEGEHGNQLYRLTANSDAPIGSTLTFSVSDHGIINNNQNGPERNSNVLTLTVTA